MIITAAAPVNKKNRLYARNIIAMLTRAPVCDAVFVIESSCCDSVDNHSSANHLVN